MAFKKIISTRHTPMDMASIISQYLFKGQHIEEYNPNNVYNTGDIVYVNTDGTILIYRVTIDGMTGEFDESKCQASTLSDELGGDEFRTIEISETQPTKPSVTTWLKPVKETSYELPSSMI